MARKKKNWVWQTTTTAGTGALTLIAGAPNGHRTFSAAGFVDTDTAVVTFSGRTSYAKEVHECTINISGGTTTITRNTLIASTTGAIISWNGVETVDVYIAPVAERTHTNDTPLILQDRVDVASASTCAIWAANSNSVRITGTTGISLFDTPTVDTGLTTMFRHLLFAGIVTITAGANVILNAGGSNITTAAGDRGFAIYEGSGVTRLFIERASGAAVASTSPSGWPRSARTSNTILGSADNRTVVDITSGTFTQTFTAAATLGSTWSLILRNSGTGDVTVDPNSSETLDGLTSFIMYPGEARFITCDGSNLYSVVLSPFSKRFTSSGTFTKPPGYNYFDMLTQGAGGGGGSGQRTATSTAKSGGSGGGGGARIRRLVLASEVGTTETVTVGAGGPGGTAQTSNTTNGNDGTDGGTTSIGSLLSTTGGKKGLGGATAGVAGGAGGGGFDAGAASAGTAGTGYQGAGGGNSGVGKTADWGGASGAFAEPNGVYNGGSALFGAAGGADGGSETAGNSLAAPGRGGKRGSITAGGGTGTAGTSHASAPVAGTSATAAGDAGGGGGAAQSAAAAAGGNGLDGGGGGGGGASNNGFNSGAGGTGGDGSAIIVGVA